MRPLPAPPGPVETALLAELAPTFSARRVETPFGALRVLEGGAGPALILIHGRGNAATTWFQMLPALARSHRVLAVDLPGFGQSEARRFRGGGFEAGLAYFTDAVEHWVVAEGLTSAAIAGHSLGGLVAVELARRGRVAPSRLALIGAMGLGSAMTYATRVFFRLGPERLARRLGRAGFERLNPPPSTPDGARLGALGFELYAARGGRPDASAAFDALCPLLGPVPHRADSLAQITAPTLILWGDHDEVFPSPVAIAAAAALPHATLRIEPLGHSPHLEAPERVLAIFEELLG
ncbi:MAG: alpha/beta fold hydrolase [Byssovorax sp.]